MIKNEIVKEHKISSNINLKNMTAEDRLIYAAHTDPLEILSKLNSSFDGLSSEQVKQNREKYGDNKIKKVKTKSISKLLFEAFINPFTAILMCLVVVSTVTDIIIPISQNDLETFNPVTVIIIVSMVIISGIMKFFQEFKSGNETEKLLSMITTKASVKRDNSKNWRDVDTLELVVGDIIHISAGDIIPADIRIIKAKDLTISQSSLTGESEHLDKTSQVINESYDTAFEYPNLAFMGSTAICGSADAIVISTGKDTFFGGMAKTISASQSAKTSFDEGVNSVSWLLIRFVLIMVPVVFFINGISKGNWVNAFTFAISIAVGLTPEMLPMIVTTCLAKGAVSMSKKKTIIKNLNSMQNFGAMDILCTDKTGTLTQDKIILEYSIDVHGNRNPRILRHAFLNSYYQTGLKNLMDNAIIEKTKKESEKEESLRNLDKAYIKVDEIPFDFNRRRMSVAVKDKNDKIQLITKGAVEEMLSICSYAEYNGVIEPLTQELRNNVLSAAHQANEDGLRVLAVAQKSFLEKGNAIKVSDEKDMVLIGYLAFLDPPKESTPAAIEALKRKGVNIKILTGDNDKVTQCVCRQVGISVKKLKLGSEIEDMDDEELSKVVEETSVFAKLSPTQKARIVSMLHKNGHVVGYMGDGINDAAAMKCADIGISVDNAVDIAKESADVILMEKNLIILEQGLIEGRKTYANMIKYIKLTASSNFGNMFSVLIASACLPFLPMASLHLILLGLIYDVCCTVIPWDNVDEEFILLPRKWDSSSVGKFMIWFGPISSIFDILTFALIYFVLCPHFLSDGLLYHEIADGAIVQCGRFAGMDLKTVYMLVFQSSWFVQSMWTQTAIIHIIRTQKIPFIQSKASNIVSIISFIGIVFATVLPFTYVGSLFGLLAPPPGFVLFLIISILLYMWITYYVKNAYIKHYKSLL